MQSQNKSAEKTSDVGATTKNQSNQQYMKYMSEKLKNSTNIRNAADRRLTQSRRGRGRGFYQRGFHLKPPSTPTRGSYQYNQNSNVNYAYNQFDSYSNFYNGTQYKQQGGYQQPSGHLYDTQAQFESYPPYHPEKLPVPPPRPPQGPVASVSKGQKSTNKSKKQSEQQKNRKGDDDSLQDKLSQKADVIINSVLNGLQVPDFSVEDAATASSSAPHSKFGSTSAKRNADTKDSNIIKPTYDGSKVKKKKKKRGGKTVKEVAKKRSKNSKKGKIQCSGDTDSTPSSVTRSHLALNVAKMVTQSSTPSKNLDLSKLVNGPRSYKDRMQVAKLLQTQRSKQKHTSRPKLDMTLSTSGITRIRTFSSDSSTVGESPMIKTEPTESQSEAHTSDIFARLGPLGDSRVVQMDSQTGSDVASPVVDTNLDKEDCPMAAETDTNLATKSIKDLPADKPQTDKDTITQALKLSLEEESIRKQQERNDAEISRLQALIHETQILLQEKLNLQNKFISRAEDLRLRRIEILQGAYSSSEPTTSQTTSQSPSNVIHITPQMSSTTSNVTEQLTASTSNVTTVSEQLTASTSNVMSVSEQPAPSTSHVISVPERLINVQGIPPAAPHDISPSAWNDIPPQIVSIDNVQWMITPLNDDNVPEQEPPSNVPQLEPGSGAADVINITPQPEAPSDVVNITPLTVSTNDDRPDGGSISNELVLDVSHSISHPNDSPEYTTTSFELETVVSPVRLSVDDFTQSDSDDDDSLTRVSSMDDTSDLNFAIHHMTEDSCPSLVSAEPEHAEPAQSHASPDEDESTGLMLHVVNSPVSVLKVRKARNVRDANSLLARSGGSMEPSSNSSDEEQEVNAKRPANRKPHKEHAKIIQAYLHAESSSDVEITDVTEAGQQKSHRDAELEMQCQRNVVCMQENYVCMNSYRGHTYAINVIQADEHHLCTGSEDATIRKYERREPCLRRTAVYDNDFIPIEHLYNHYVDERTSVLLAAGSSTYLYKLDTLLQLYKVSHNICCFHASWDFLYIGLENGGIACFDLKKMYLVDTLPHCLAVDPICCIRSTCINEQKLLCVALKNSFNVILRDFKSGIMYKVLTCHPSKLLDMMIRDDSLYTISAAGILQVFSIQRDKLEHSVRYNKVVTAACFSKNQVTLCCTDGQLQCFNLHNPEHSLCTYTNLAQCDLTAISCCEDQIYVGTANGSLFSIEPSTVVRCMFALCNKRYSSHSELMKHLVYEHILTQPQRTMCLWPGCKQFLDTDNTNVQLICQHMKTHLNI